MSRLATRIACFGVLLAALVAAPSSAHGQEGNATRLVVPRPQKDRARRTVDASKAGFRLEVDAMCEPNADGVTGSATGWSDGVACPIFGVPTSTDRPQNFLAIMGRAYSVDIVVEEEQAGRGQDRALRMASAHCPSANSEANKAVTFADRHFVLVGADTENSSQLCFATSDDRSEVAVVVFRALDHEGGLHFVHPEFQLHLGAEAEAVMATLQPSTGATSAAPSTSPAATTPPRVKTGGNSKIGIVIAIGLAAVAVIASLLGRARRSPRKKARADRDLAQLAGSKCVACKRNVVSERDAVHCSDCALPVHKDCLARHMNASHDDKPGIYR